MNIFLKFEQFVNFSWQSFQGRFIYKVWSKSYHTGSIFLLSVLFSKQGIFLKYIAPELWNNLLIYIRSDAAKILMIRQNCSGYFISYRLLFVRPLSHIRICVRNRTLILCLIRLHFLTLCNKQYSFSYRFHGLEVRYGCKITNKLQKNPMIWELSSNVKLFYAVLWFLMLSEFPRFLNPLCKRFWTHYSSHLIFHISITLWKFKSSYFWKYIRFFRFSIRGFIKNIPIFARNIAQNSRNIRFLSQNIG